MKQFCSLLLSFALTGTTSLGMAQSKPDTSRPSDRLFKRATSTTASIPQGRPQASSVAGIVVNHQWDSDNKMWSNGVKTAFQYNSRGQVLEAVRTDTVTNVLIDKVAYTIAANGLVTQRLMQVYDNATKTFVDNTRKLISYDAAGLDTFRLEQRYDSKTAKFVDQKRERHRYNAAGLDTLLLVQTYDEGKSVFVNYQRIRQRYDGQNNQSFYLSQDWDNTSKAWKIASASRTTSTYNATGGCTKQVNEQYDDSLKSFVPTQQIAYALNARNEPTEIVNAEWDGKSKVFVNMFRSINITWYNFAQDKPSYSETQQWDFTSQKWLNSQRGTATYQPNGSSVVLVQEFVAAPDVYQNRSRGTETYDDLGNNLLSRFEEWGKDQWKIENETRSLIAYNADQQVRRLILQRLDVETMQHENITLSRYDNYSIITKTQPNAVLAAATTIFPNPTSGNKVTVTLAGLLTSTPVPAELLNTLGQVVSTLTLQPRQGRIEQELNLTNLPAGLYILRLHAGSESISKRLVKQ